MPATGSVSANGSNDPVSREILRVERKTLQPLLDSILTAGYRLVGPTIRDNAIVYDDVRSVDDLPIGWQDEQNAGHYRLKKGDEQTVFGFTVSPHSWKKYLFPPRKLLWNATRDGNAIRFVEAVPNAERLALLGVRSCELEALAIQDRVFLPTDAHYRAQREKLLIIAVQCGIAGGTCFCASMNTGPRAYGGFDLALTEIIHAQEHYFLAEIGSEAGAAVLSQVPVRIAGQRDLEAGTQATERAIGMMGRAMECDDLKDLLYRNYENRHWTDVAARCLTCANCTMVCPTCFCHTVSDSADLTGDHAQRWRHWDSCFNLEFSYLHGGNARPSPAARYRHWITHKLAAWQDQFGTSGCVGCGRCITWCPVGIDLTAEVRAIRESEDTHGEHRENHC